MEIHFFYQRNDKKIRAKPKGILRHMKKKLRGVMLLTISALSGFCNAIIGAGGGIILSFALIKLARDEIPDRRDVYVNSQAAMIPGCALSCLIYSMSSSLDTTGFSIYAIPAAIGGMLGSFLLTKIKSTWISKLFAILVIWSGTRMIAR